MNYELKTNNQTGMVPIIYIVAAVVIVGIFAVIFFQFSNKPKVSPPPDASETTGFVLPDADKDCADRDYTGCDGVEVVKWTDDGKR